MVGCEARYHDEPELRALFLLFGEAIIGMSQCGTLAEGLTDMMKKTGAFPTFWVKPRSS